MHDMRIGLLYNTLVLFRSLPWIDLYSNSAYRSSAQVGILPLDLTQQSPVALQHDEYAGVLLRCSPRYPRPMQQACRLHLLAVVLQ